MSELDGVRLDELRTALRVLAGELEAMTSQAKDGVRPVDLDEPIGRVSRIDAIAQQKMNQANLGAARQRLAQARAALQRIDDDEYGECRACGEEIAFARLQAAPETAFCVECQGRRESSR